MVALSGLRVADNVLQLPEGGDLEALHCQPRTNFDRSTKLDLTTKPPLSGRCCYGNGLLFNHFESLINTINSKEIDSWWKCLHLNN